MIKEETFKRRFVPKLDGAGNHTGGYHVETEEVEPVEYSGWVRPNLSEIPWGNLAKLSIWLVGMVAFTAVGWTAITHSTAGILDQINGHHDWTVTIGH